jgi:hypothetical protein
VCTILLVLLVAVNGKMNILPLHLWANSENKTWLTATLLYSAGSKQRNGEWKTD